jgi:hypothetical protein
VRALRAIVDYPVLLPSGEVLTLAGYHANSNLFLAPHGALNLRVPTNPTHTQAVAAVEQLFEVVADFPFANLAHRSAWLAALLTLAARWAFEGPAPLFLIDGNVAGVGKGLLADTIALIVTGRRFAIDGFPGDGEELRKKITSWVLRGQNYVLLDNLTGDVGGGELDRALTATEWDDRILGTNQSITAPLAIVWYATGNNVTIRGDTNRRVCHIRLDTLDERPERRTDFRYPDLRQHISANRAELLTAVFTILVGYLRAGRPRQPLAGWGSFDGWSALVRQAIVWAGQPDPGTTRDLDLTHSDERIGWLTALLPLLRRLDLDNRGLTAKQLVTRIEQIEPHQQWEQDLAELFGQLCPSNRNSTTYQLGQHLAVIRNRNLGGLMIESVGKSGGCVRWRVVDACNRRRANTSAPLDPPTERGGGGGASGGGAVEADAPFQEEAPCEII